MASEVANPSLGHAGHANTPSTPLEVRVAFVGLLGFATLLPVQVMIRVPGMAVPAAVSPADLPLALGVLAYLTAVLRGTARVQLGSFGIAVGAYLLCVVASVASSESLGRSVVRSANVLVCAGAALLAAHLVDSDAKLRKVVQAWMVGTILTVILGLAAIAFFYLGAAPALVASLTSDFGSLPSGNYPRVAALFAHQPNTLCHYLSVSLFVVLGARSAGWLGRRLALGLGMGVLAVSASTFSLGLGGIALGLGWWLAWNPASSTPSASRRAALATGVVGAVAFAILMVLAPAPRQGAMPLFSFRAEPSPRVVCWKAAWEQFASDPILGRGLGVQPTCPAYVVAWGATARLTDAHSMYLSVASTQGLLGLLGLGVVIGIVLRRSFPLPRQPDPIALVVGALAIAFAQSWLYHGLAGSFEYTRHGWLLMGLLWATLAMAGGVARQQERASNT